MWRVSENNIPTEIFELKRSYIDIESWSPFKQDYNNFRLLSNLALLTNLKFKIIYYVRQKNPWVEDISKIKVFNVNFNRKVPINLWGIYQLNDFIEDI